MKTLMTAIILFGIFALTYKVGTSISKEEIKSATSAIGRIRDSMTGKNVSDQRELNYDLNPGESSMADSSIANQDLVHDENQLFKNIREFDPVQYIESLTQKTTNKEQFPKISEDISQLTDLLSSELSDESIDSIKAGYYDRIDKNLNSILKKGTR